LYLIPHCVFDAVLFSKELDLLTIRWHELDPFVTNFVILESNTTFTGLSNPLNFSMNMQQFEFAEAKLKYGTAGGDLFHLERVPLYKKHTKEWY
jgi:beta-1,4-mannosyl-glycoprotein beta-1,4-N-acetylglucosaminyltransferase